MTRLATDETFAALIALFLATMVGGLTYAISKLRNRASKAGKTTVVSALLSSLVFTAVGVAFGPFAVPGSVVFAVVVVIIIVLLTTKNWINKTTQELLDDFDNRYAEQRFIVIENLFRKLQEQTNTDEHSDIKEQIKALRNELRINMRSPFFDSSGELGVEEDPKHVIAITHNRLLDTENRLINRSRNNLSYGIISSGLGFVVILGAAIYFAFSGTTDWSARLLSYLPFLTGGIALQLVGVFFLKTYQAIEADITKNKNEITNVEMRLAAVMMAKPAQKGEIITQFLTEERNFILKKDEKTAAESQPINIETLKELLPLYTDTIKAGTSK